MNQPPRKRAPRQTWRHPLGGPLPLRTLAAVLDYSGDPAERLRAARELFCGLVGAPGLYDGEPEFRRILAGAWSLDRAEQMVESLRAAFVVGW